MSPRLRMAGVLALMLACTPSQSAKLEFAGHYRWNGQDGSGADLILTADHRFQFAMTAQLEPLADRYGRGQWSLAPTGELLLKPDPPPPLKPRVSELRAQPWQEEPKPDAEPEPESLLMVGLGSEAYGMTFSGIQVTARFDNGRERSARTPRSGRLSFIQRAEPEWRGAQIIGLRVGETSEGIEPLELAIVPGKTRVVIVDVGMEAQQRGNLGEGFMLSMRRDAKRGLLLCHDETCDEPLERLPHSP